MAIFLAENLKVTHPYTGRVLRLAYLAPAVLERLLIQRAARLQCH